MPKVYFQSGTMCEEMCNLCGFTSHSETTIKLHMKFVHKKTNLDVGGKSNFVCGICFKKFDAKKELTTHIESHDVRFKGGR